MKKRLIFLLLLITFKLSGSLSIQMGGELSFPWSSYISQYLEAGHGGSISIITKKDFWPLSLEFSGGYTSYSLKDKPNYSLEFFPITAAFLYKLPLQLKLVELYPFIETGVNIEVLRTSTSKELNTTFYSGLGLKVNFMLIKNFQPGFSLKWIMVHEKEETASFFNIKLHFNFVL